MLDFAMYASQIEQEFSKIEGTDSVEIRCSLPASFLTTSVLDELVVGVGEALAATGFQVDAIRFANDTFDEDSKDFFIKATKV